MIRVSIKPNGFEAKGHAEFAERGKDTVCAAISGIIQTCALGLMDRTDNKAKVQRGDGMFRVTLLDGLTNQIKHDCDIIIGTMRLGLQDMQRQYPKHIKVN